MTALGDAALRQLALKALAHHAGPAANAAAVAAATRRAYNDLTQVSIPLIGQVGVDALTRRALHLAQLEYSWLADARGPEHVGEPFAQVIVSLERQPPAIATAGAATVLVTFTGLLVTFIGEPLTTGLLRQAWPKAFSDTHTEET